MYPIKRRPPPPIQLDLDEASVLSFVARHAHISDRRTRLEEILDTASETAKAIGYAILDPDAPTEEKFRIMADRFINARRNNIKFLKYLHGGPYPHI